MVSQQAICVLFFIVDCLSLTWASLSIPKIMSTNTTDCAALSLILPGKVWFPGSAEYTAEKVSYFAAFENEISPTCFVQPSNVDEVVKVVDHLRCSPLAGHTKVAIRSGGHTAWAGSANCPDGITIDLSKLKTVNIDPKTKIASIGVGNQWVDVYSKLGEQGLAIVGGRVGKVGVGGLVLGGKLVTI